MQTRNKSTVPNSTYTQGGVPCFADTFVGIESSVLRINFGGKNLALRVAAKHYHTFTMKTTFLLLFLILTFSSCNLIRILHMSERNDESKEEVDRFLKKYNYDFSLFADDSKSYLHKTKIHGINDDTTKYSYIQLRIYNRDGSLYSAYSQCMGDFNSRNFMDSFPLKKTIIRMSISN
jgi:hypothetical protein